MIIHVNVKPGAREEKIEKISDNDFNAWVEEKAEDNKANIKLMKMLAGYFGVSIHDIRIKTPKSRKKIIEIS